MEIPDDHRVAIIIARYRHHLVAIDVLAGRPDWCAGQTSRLEQNRFEGVWIHCEKVPIVVDILVVGERIDGE